MSNRSSRVEVAGGITVTLVAHATWQQLSDLFGRAGASNGCWCQYWLIGPEYHRRERALNRRALHDEIEPPAAPRPGLLAQDPDGETVGWARLTPRSELSWLRTRFAKSLPDGGDEIWSVPCFFVRTRSRINGVMSALIAGSIDIAGQYGIPVLEGYPIDPAVEGATRNRFAGILESFLRAGFSEVSRLSGDRALVRYRLRDDVPGREGVDDS